jgi:hypothetical protein
LRIEREKVRRPPLPTIIRFDYYVGAGNCSAGNDMLTKRIPTSIRKSALQFLSGLPVDHYLNMIRDASVNMDLWGIAH